MAEERFGGVDPGELEAHRAWLRGLAGALLRDPDQAEDCVQDVFFEAIRRGPRRLSSAHSLRAWLRGVLVNRARKLGDRQTRRRFHEERARTEGSASAPDDSLELRELQAELQRNVMRLDERYRTVVLLRHRDELPPAEIAARLDVPVKTVNSWLYRAYGRLRQQLERRYEGPDGWIAILALSVRPPEPTSAGAPGAPGRAGLVRSGLRGSRWALACAGLLLVVAGSLWLPRVLGPRTAAPAQTLAYGAAEPVRQGMPDIDVPGSGERTRRLAVPASPLPPAPAPTWSGVVVDTRETPVPGLRLHLEPLGAEDQRYFNDHANAGFNIQQEFRAPEGTGNAEREGPRECVSRADGSFSIDAPAWPCWIDTDDPEWTLVATSTVLEPPPLGSARVVVAHARRVAGRVLTEQGLPLGGVRVELRLPEALLTRETGYPTNLVYEPKVLTADDGTFEFADLPALPDALLHFEQREHASAERRLDPALGSLDEIEVSLVALGPGEALRGRALDSAGRPVGGAVLTLDWTGSARSDADGRFSLPLRAAGSLPRDGTLRAAAPGFQPVLLSLSEALAEDAHELEVVFTAPALALEGVVLRADGSPHSNAVVWLPAPMALSLPEGIVPPIFAEHVMGGAQEGGSLEVAETDFEGHFRLSGLQDRPCVLRVADRDTCEWFTSERLHPGQDDVLLEFPPDGCVAERSGSVVGIDGLPVSAALVARAYPRLDLRLPDGRRMLTRFAGDKLAVGIDGRFTLTEVPRHGGVLAVFGPSIQTCYVEMDACPQEMRIVVGRLCRAVVERPGLAFDRFSFAAEQEPFEFTAVKRGVLESVVDAPMTSERSAEYLVSDLARELVLWSGEHEVTRVRIELIPGTLNVLRP